MEKCKSENPLLGKPKTCTCGIEGCTGRELLIKLRFFHRWGGARQMGRVDQRSHREGFLYCLPTWLRQMHRVEHHSKSDPFGCMGWYRSVNPLLDRSICLFALRNLEFLMAQPWIHLERQKYSQAHSIYLLDYCSKLRIFNPMERNERELDIEQNFVSGWNIIFGKEEFCDALRLFRLALQFEYQLLIEGTDQVPIALFQLGSNNLKVNLLHKQFNSPLKFCDLSFQKISKCWQRMDQSPYHSRMLALHHRPFS